MVLKKIRKAKLLLSACLIITGVFVLYGFLNAEDSVTLNYTGTQQTWIVPAGVTSIQVDARGGRGGDGGVRWPPPEGEGAKGARVQTTLSVTAGETLYIYVGGGGNGITGGWNGGGDGGVHGPSDGYDAGGGGGASDIRQGSNVLDDRVVVAGGGGGGGGLGWANSVHGGVGGSGGENGASGGSGINSSGVSCTTGGGGGTQSAGGVYPGCGSAASGGTDGGYGYGGHGCNGDLFLGGGGAGGGSGYYGGGGGGYSGWCGGAGGGGGSSYSVGTGTAYTSGYQSGNGQIVITYASLSIAPTLTSVSESTDPIEEGTTQTITPSGQGDPDSDDLRIYCCQDISNACIPTTLNTCNNNQAWSFPYSSMTCTLTAPDVSSTTIYYARCRLYDGTSYSPTTAGTSYSVSTLAPIITAPTVVTNSATNIEQTQATLNGNLTDMGGDSSCDVWFEWGTSSGSYSYSTAPVAKTSTGKFSKTISGLTAQTTYYFRAAAQNSEGISYGSELSFPTPATPITEHDVWGWAWSENIGWVSFSSDNMGGPVNYGVQINIVDSTTGQLSGYAWSEHIGWISFNTSDLAGCPVAPCEALVDLGTGYVSGWAKALVDGGGWTGWMRLRGSTYGTWINAEPDPSEFMDWAWSDLNIGWLSFNCVNTGWCGVSDYKVMTSLTFAPEIPIPEVTPVGYDFIDPCSQSRIPKLIWTTDAARPYYYEIEIDDDFNFNSPNVTNASSLTSSVSWIPGCNLCCSAAPYNTILFGGNTYYWRARAKNQEGEWGEWSSPASFITKAHCYPYPDFLCNGVDCANVAPAEDDIVSLGDNSSYDDGRDHCEWSLPSGATTSNNVNSDCEIDVQFPVGENQLIVLDVFDSASYSCSASKTMNVSAALSLPEWKEVEPF